MTQLKKMYLSGAVILFSLAALVVMGARTQRAPVGLSGPGSLTVDDQANRVNEAPRIVTFSQFYAELSGPQQDCFKGKVGESRTQQLSGGSERITDQELEALNSCIN